jgi:hypothetical protein
VELCRCAHTIRLTDQKTLVGCRLSIRNALDESIDKKIRRKRYLRPKLVVTKGVHCASAAADC